MADMAANHCMKAHREGKFFSLEHPKNSIARKLPSWEELESLDGVMCTEYHTCMFHPSERRKSQCLIHNMPSLVPFLGKTCQGQVCQRTGKKHKDWRPKVEKGRVLSFATGEEREYPAGFCTAYASALKDLYDQEDFIFLEIFSGPNAPLSTAVASHVGESLEEPRSSLTDPLAASTERSRIVEPTPSQPPEPALPSTPQATPTQPEREILFPEEEGRTYRRDAVAAGKQPSYGKRVQLIPDGMHCPRRHLEIAKTLPHPFSSLEPLKSDHHRVVEILKREGKQIIKQRLEALHDLEVRAETLRQRQQAANRDAAWTAKKLGCKIQTLLMQSLQEDLGIEDKEVPRACMQGLGIVGNASESAFFEPFLVPASVSWGKYLATCQSRSQDMIDRVKFMARKCDDELVKAIHAKTLKEVQAGRMGPPLTLEDVKRRYGQHFQVVPSFGLSQKNGCARAPKIPTD